MTGFLLDTNVPSETIRPRPDANVVHWLGIQTRLALFASVISMGEFRRGAAVLPLSARRTRFEYWIDVELVAWFGDRVLPITHIIADRWGRLAAQRRLAGKPLSATDGLIAATALEHGLTLVTRNVADFDELGLTILNPWAT